MTYAPWYSEATRLAQNDAYADDSHALLFNAEDWPRHVTGLPDFSPAASFLALDGTEVAAFVCSTVRAQEGNLHILGTRPKWRGHGLAAADLIRRALTAYQDAGLTTARVQVCSSNARAVGLYTKLGFSTSGPGYALLYAQVALPAAVSSEAKDAQGRFWLVSGFPVRLGGYMCDSGTLLGAAMSEHVIPGTDPVPGTEPIPETDSAAIPRPRESQGQRSTVTARSMSAATASFVWGLTRIAIGFVFFWAFLDKTFGLGKSTPSAKAWIHGGSPTTGFLDSVSGPFAGFFHGMAGQTWADYLFMIGLCGIGAALLLGVAMRIATLGGVVLLVFMWMASLPIASNPFLDEHLIYALVLIGLALVHADHKIGLGSWWERLPVIGRF